MPSCFSSLEKVLFLSVYGPIRIPSFASFHPNLGFLVVNDCSFDTPTPATLPSATPDAPNPSGPVDGFKDDGTLDWDEVFSLLPQIFLLSLEDDGLTGSLPAELPAGMQSFQIGSNLLTGTIPSTILNQFTGSNGYILDISNNSLTGTIPETLFGPIGASPRLPVLFGFLASHNQLTGIIPQNLLFPLTSSLTPRLRLDLSHNRLSGTIPTNFFPSDVLDPNNDFNTLSFLLQNNRLTGDLPSMFGPNTRLSSLTFNVSNNLLNGTLPAALLSNLTSGSDQGDFEVYLDHNTIQGTIPSGFITRESSANVTYYSFTLHLQNNNLTGSIPRNLLYAYSSLGNMAAIEAAYYDVQLSSNNLTGTLPGGFFLGANSSTLISMSFKVDHNHLTGIIPEDLFIKSRPITPGAIEFDATDNLLSGSPPTLCWPSSSIAYTVLLGSNQLTGSIPSSWNECIMPKIDLSANRNLGGTIPPLLLSNAGTTYFNASSTSLSGDLFIIGAPMKQLDLSRTDIDFCSSSSRSIDRSHNNFTVCNLFETRSCRCQASYSQCQSTCPVYCPGDLPKSDYYCDNGTWKTASVSTDTFTLPSGVGTVLVLGNLSSSSIEISGVSSSVVISGCASNLSTVHVELSKDVSIVNGRIYSLVSTSPDSNCSTDLNTVKLTASIQGCRKVTVETYTSTDGKNLGGLFIIDKSACNTWWIILVSVICGVILVVLIALVLMAIFWPAFRAKIRPFSTKPKRSNGQVV